MATNPQSHLRIGERAGYGVDISAAAAELLLLLLLLQLLLLRRCLCCSFCVAVAAASPSASVPLLRRCLFCFCVADAAAAASAPESAAAAVDVHQTSTLKLCRRGTKDQEAIVADAPRGPFVLLFLSSCENEQGCCGGGADKLDGTADVKEGGRCTMVIVDERSFFDRLWKDSL
jgi:hypothetical protein